MSISPDFKYFDRFKVVSKLGEGSFGKIYKGIDVLSRKLVAIKIETKKTRDNSQLKTEARIYKELEGTPITQNVKWPEIHSFGRDPSGNYVLIMQILGPNIETLMKKTQRGYFSAISVAYIADKMITLVERFHQCGYVHRDLKPQNFVIEYVDDIYPKFPEIYLIDYGLAKTFLEEDLAHADFKEDRSLKGTVRYSSINTHLGVRQSRRDDMNSLGYIFLYLLIGKLPWQNLMKDREKSEAYHHIMLVKMSTPIEDLVERVPESIKAAMSSYLLYVGSLMYHQVPNYDYLRNLFKSNSKNFTGNIFR